jgi:hypothetical protein
MGSITKVKRVSSPASQLSGFIDRFTPAIAKLVRTARTRLRKRLPTAVELVYDNYNALAIGYGPNERTSDAIVSLAVYARGVNLYFLEGAYLPDPECVLQGSGTRGRFVRLTDPSMIDSPTIVQLLRAAVEAADAPFPSSGRGRTVIKSVSAKQRARR